MSKFLDEIERNAQRVQTIKDAKIYIAHGVSPDVVIGCLSDNLNINEAEAATIFNNEVLENTSEYLEELEYLVKNHLL